MDGTHIQIDRPSKDPDSYINRKGFHSIQMQGICNHNRKFIDIFIGYPGSVHDARVFNNAPILEKLNALTDGRVGQCRP